MIRFDKDETPQKLGEFGLIERIARMAGSHRSEDATGIGDDCAMIQNVTEQKALLLTTDMLLEGRHFNRNWITAEDLGYKSLAVNLSDISAMGGRPRYALLSIGLPPDTAPEWLNGFFGETSRLCKKHGVELIGGDTVKSSSIVVNYTVLGLIEEEKVLWRSGAVPGDKIGLIGITGEAGAGLRLLKESHAPDLPLHRHLIRAHNRPPIHVGEAIHLAESGAVHAMIDVSDGIESDAGHIAKQSGVNLTIETDMLPVSDQLAEVCRNFSWPLEEITLAAGEDYALLFTFDANKEDFLKQSFSRLFPETHFSVIGQISEGDAAVRFLKDGKPYELRNYGFDQFKSE